MYKGFHSPSSVSWGLRKLVLGPDLYLHPMHILGYYDRGVFEGLEELQFRGSTYGSPLEIPYRDLSLAMASHLPNLRTFRFASMRDQWPTGSCPGFESFVDCKNLTVLDTEGRTFEFEPEELLEPRCPPGLKFLRLWSDASMDSLSKQYANLMIGLIVQTMYIYIAD
jgi:hypothetical protein